MATPKSSADSSMAESLASCQLGLGTREFGWEPAVLGGICVGCRVRGKENVLLKTLLVASNGTARVSLSQKNDFEKRKGDTPWSSGRQGLWSWVSSRTGTKGQGLWGRPSFLLLSGCAFCFPPCTRLYPSQSTSLRFSTRQRFPVVLEPLPDTWESGFAWPSLAWLSTSGPISCGQLWWPQSCPGACHLGGHWKYAHFWESTPEAEQGTDVKKPTRLGTSNPRRIFIFFRDKGYKGLIIFIKKKK